MKGLVMKDILEMRSYLKFLIFFVVIYGAMCVVTESPNMIFGVFAILASLLPMTAMGYDSACGWDQYAQTLPLSCLEIVFSKYVIGIGCVLLDLIGTLLVVLCTENEIGVLGAVVSCSAVLILQSISIPVAYKVGTEKARFVVIGIVLIPVILLGIAARAGVQMPTDAVIKRVLFGVPVLAIVLLIVSVKVSMSIVKNKEW